MNGEEQIVGGRECGEEVAAYVLRALEPSEAQAFRTHMAGCPACREEVAAFEQVVEAMPAPDAEQPVPRELRRRVMREVRAAPREPAAARTTRPRPVDVPVARRRLLAWGAPVVALAVAVLAFALISGGSTGTRVIQARVTAPTATVQLRIANGRGELIARGLPVPPAGRIYEMWVQRGNGRPTPTGTLFGVTSAGSAAVGVPGSLNGVSSVMVTQEPAGGTLVPTSAPVIVAPVT